MADVAERRRAVPYLTCVVSAINVRLRRRNPIPGFQSHSRLAHNQEQPASRNLPKSAEQSKSAEDSHRQPTSLEDSRTNHRVLRFRTTDSRLGECYDGVWLSKSTPRRLNNHSVSSIYNSASQAYEPLINFKV